MTKIQEPDNSVMNRLYAKAAGKKIAAEANGEGLVSEPAFKDHEEYLSTLDGILSDTKKTSWDPNDPILD